MPSDLWTEEFPGAITVCDPDGIILQMNEKAAQLFKGYGGKDLVGTNVLDCHPEPARTKLSEMLGKQTRNVYTTEKAGVRKIIYQAPWYNNGQYAGFVELSFEIPEQMPHPDRNG
jgi:transcriptional regulator with PAS, ATPase and Fis domain